MNSEKRHELQQNVLASYCGELLKKIEPHTKLILVGFVVIVAAVVAYGYSEYLKTEAKSIATLELLQNANSGDAEALASLGDNYPNTVAGSMARLYEADTNLGAGITALFADREEGESKIQDAIRAYKNVTLTAKDKLLLARAHFGLGRAYESLGQTKEAISAYEASAAITESKAVAEAAKQRIALLQKPETQEFLTWFAKQDFRPADPTAPPNFPDGGGLPDLPDLDLPPVTPMNIPDELKAGSDPDGKEAPGAISLPSDAEAAEATESTPAETVELEMPKQDAPAAPTPSTTEAPASADAPAEVPATTLEPSEASLEDTKAEPVTDGNQ
jgi:tetratricopeptide (TPR) repeat protein